MRLLVLTALLLCALTGSAKIWQVNNSGKGLYDFTTLQAAHDGATAGDTVYLAPSPNSYGGATITKRLIIFGVGYYLRENFPEYPHNLTSIYDGISFQSGSSGSVISGCYIVSYINIRTSEITITRNNCSVSIGANDLSKILIKNNRLLSLTSGGDRIFNSLISNNLIQFTGGSFSAQAVSSLIFSHNIISGQTITLYNQTVYNNIYLSGSFTLVDCTPTNNIDASGSSSFLFGTSAGNKGGFTSSQVFVGPTGNSTDGQWRLKAGSPAIGAGATGEDCGIFGGNDPYVLSGLPPVPIIKKLFNTGVGNNTTKIKVTISVESRN
ncbi:MAG: hypothetical protein ACKOAR_14130 [Bacteroidota bacterium]